MPNATEEADRFAATGVCSMADVLDQCREAGYSDVKLLTQRRLQPASRCEESPTEVGGYCRLKPDI